MHIVQLTPGTGSFFCGSCLRDVALVNALRARGHEVTLAPLYLPFMLEEEADEEPVHLGGINAWLQENLPFVRFIPRGLRGWLDAPWLLRWASTKGNMTNAADLGAMTLSMLRGEQGRQRQELETLLGWFDDLPRPDVIVLSNAMLLGLARSLRAHLGVPVLCTLQGEAPFLDDLTEPWRTQAWELLQERARDAAGFLAVSGYTAELMTRRLRLDAEHVHVVHNGIDPAAFPAPAAEPEARTLTFLARLCRDKGLPTLVEAFLLLKQRPDFQDVRLVAAGVVLGEDKPVLRDLERKLRDAGFEGDFEFRANVTKEEKLAVLHGASVFSVPATYGESFGLYLLEAWACGIPVVQPRHGAFPELLEATGGGFLCAPDDPRALADALGEVLADRERARELGRSGQSAVQERFTAERMARDVERVCTMAADPEAAPVG